MTATVDYRGAFWFPVVPVVLWDTVEQLDRFPAWWSWLQDFRPDGDGLAPGTVLHGTVVPPVPYRLRLEVHLRHCERPRLLEASVEGDLRGYATVELAPLRDGTQVDAAWSLDFVSAPLRLASRVAYPVMRWGHDRVVDMAVSGFRRRALGP